jgi:hypothetical protein
MSFSWRWDRQSICGEETMGCESVTSQLTEVAKLRRCDGRRDLVQNGTPPLISVSGVPQCAYSHR